MADQVLDAKGLNCPLPILRAKKALAGMGTGSTLEIVASRAADWFTRHLPASRT